MLKHYRLFQAWQSQNKEYTDFLTKLLAEVSERQKQKGIEIEIIRFPAQDQAGSPDVVNMVWKQIADCDLFVGDLTKIAASDSHAISNPNVMYEVGIADALLGEKRVILVCSKDTNVSKLAFVASGGSDRALAPIQYMLFADKTVKENEELFGQYLTLMEEIGQEEVNQAVPETLKIQEEAINELRQNLKDNPNPQLQAALNDMVREFERQKREALSQYVKPSKSYSYDPATILRRLKSIAVNPKLSLFPKHSPPV